MYRAYSCTCTSACWSYPKVIYREYERVLPIHYRRQSVALDQAREGRDSSSNRALVNAVWNLYAKIEGKPLWKLLVDITFEQLVACTDFRYITEALPPEEALALLHTHTQIKENAKQRCYNTATRSTPHLRVGSAILTRKCITSALL